MNRSWYWWEVGLATRIAKIGSVKWTRAALLLLAALQGQCLGANSLICWGNNLVGQTNVPAAASNVIAIACGDFHSLAVREDGQVVAWGKPVFGDTVVPWTATNVIAVSAGAQHSVALRADGTVIAWGDPSQTNVPPAATGVVAIASGDYHNLALKADGSVVAWGTNTNFQINVPASATNIIAIGAGASSSYAIRRDGTVLAWGNYSFGLTNIPVSATNVQTIEAGASHALALREDGRVVLWGSSVTNGLTNPSNILAIAAGYSHSLAIRENGTVHAWGNPYTSAATNVPAAVSNVIAIAAGFDHSLAICSDGRPNIVRHPKGGLRSPGNDIVFSVGAVGASPLKYQWQRDGLDLPLATNKQLTVVVSNQSQAGLYSVTVTNNLGSVTSSTALLRVMTLGEAVNASNLVWSNSGNSWLAQELVTHDGVAAARGLGRLFPESLSHFLSTSVEGPGTLTFWWKSQIGSGGYNDTALTLYVGTSLSAQLRDSTDWTNATVYIGSGPTTLTWRCHQSYINVPVNGWLDEVTFVPGGTPPLITSISADQTLPAGTNFFLSVTSVGAPTLSYQWRFNDNNITNQTSRNLSIQNAQPQHSGIYEIVVANAFGNTNRQINILVTNRAPVLLFQPTNQTRALRGKVSFQVSARGSDPLIYQWQHDNADLPGATNPILTLTNLSYVDAGDYRCVVSNAYGTSPSSSASLIVGPTAVVAWGSDIYKESQVPAELTNATAVSAGEYLSMVLRNDGKVLAWGENASGQTNVPAAATNMVRIAAGNDNGLALRADGSAMAWGVSWGNIPVNDLREVSSKEGHHVGLRFSGTSICWGRNEFGQANQLPNPQDLIAVAAGGYHNLALRRDGTVAAWGYNPFGQNNVPVGTSNIVAVAAGGQFSTALRKDGTIVSWGEFDSSDVPPTATNVVALSAGWHHVLALREDGTLVSWGDDDFKETILPDYVENVVAISAGYHHNLAILGDGSPFVVRQPWNLQAPYGSDVAFSVGAVGRPLLRYQWQFNGVDIAQGTNAILTLSKVKASQNGNYSCIITNSFGTTASSAATLDVTGQPLEIDPGSLAWNPGNFTMRVIGSSGSRPLIVSASTNLLAWEPVLTNAPASGTIQVSIPLDPNRPRRFFRAEER